MKKHIKLYDIVVTILAWVIYMIMWITIPQEFKWYIFMVLLGIIILLYTIPVYIRKVE